MKKFKLIKEYPGSPKLGVIANDYRNSLQGQYYYTLEEGYGQINKELVDGQTEYWEEIKEKTYEIMAYKTENGAIWERRGDNFYCEPFGAVIEETLTSVGVDIYSIKRLLDGKIFTIKDNTNYGIIKSFGTSSYFKDRIFIKFEGEQVCKYLDASIELNKFIPKVLFTTEDGVGIKEGDKYFSVLEPDWNYEIVEQECTNKGLSYQRPGIKHFSIKEKAEEYKLMNKNSLSINELQNIFLTAKCLDITNVNDITNHAITIVKSRK